MSLPEPTDKPEPYGSAHDLPSFVEMRLQLKAFKALTLFVMRDKRDELSDIERQMSDLADTVDAFYARLGARHWIFNDWMNLTAVQDLLNETSTADDAERRLIEMYRDQDTARIRMLQLRNVPGLRERHHQLERAREDYNAGRFDSCAMTLITVMDGFVNDFEADQRKGLAARDPDDMVAWDSVVGHHLGLTNAMKPFLKTIKKRVDDEVFELHRHGIVHGSVVNFNNVTVATKAWNMLFAVVDWSKQTTKLAIPKEETPTLRETVSRLGEHGRRKRARDTFVPSELPSSDPSFAKNDVIRQTELFFEAWTRGQWGRIVPLIPSQLVESKSNGEAAGSARGWFERSTISDARLDKVEYTQSSVAEVWGEATIDNRSGILRLRWVRWNEDGDLAIEGEEGTWRLAVIAPNTYLVDENGERLS